MSYKTVLVHLDASRSAAARLDVALSLARDFGAHLTGMFATFVPDPRSFYVMAGSAEYFEASRPARDERRSAIEQLFHAGLTRANIDGDWVVASGYADEAVTRAGRGVSVPAPAARASAALHARAWLIGRCEIFPAVAGAVVCVQASRV